MKLKSASVEDYSRVFKTIKRLKGKDAVLYFPDFEGLDEIELIVYSDASFSNLDNSTGSTIAYIVFCRRGKKSCPITWKANKAQRVVQSSLAAEALALSKALGEAYYQQSFIKETLNINAKITAYVDNKELVENVYSTSLLDDKRLNLDVALIKEMVNKGEVENILWLPGPDQLADCMTKRGQSGDQLRQAMQQGTLKLN